MKRAQSMENVRILPGTPCSPLTLGHELIELHEQLDEVVIVQFFKDGRTQVRATRDTTNATLTWCGAALLSLPFEER